MLLPATCAVCRTPPRALCPACRQALPAAPPGPVPPGLTSLGVVLAYEDAGRELVARLKYRNARGMVPWLAAEMAAAVSGPVPDVVTWVPTTPSRRRRRGYDQAELLARGVARRLGLPCSRLLRRAEGLPQTGRGRDARLTGPALGPARQWGRRRGPPAGVLLVDDVVTTGATMAAAAAVLRAAGTAEVAGLAAARTPRRHVPPTCAAVPGLVWPSHR